jgi:hypothetical protein
MYPMLEEATLMNASTTTTTSEQGTNPIKTLNQLHCLN